MRYVEFESIFSSSRTGRYLHACNGDTRLTQTNILDAARSLGSSFTHNKLVAELGFGFWRYMFSNNQFKAGDKHCYEFFQINQ